MSFDKHVRKYTNLIPEIYPIYNAFSFICNSSSGIVTVVNGLVKQTKNCNAVLTEPSEKGYSNKFTVCPRVMKLGISGTSSRVPVKLLKIQEHTNICELHETDVLR